MITDARACLVPDPTQPDAASATGRQPTTPEPCLTATLVSVVTGIVLLNVLDAPREVFALVIAMLAGLASALAVTVWWQISVHNAVAGGSVMILVLVFGQVLVLPAVLFVAAIRWSCRVLKARTLAQLVCGTALGSIAALVFTLLR